MKKTWSDDKRQIKTVGKFFIGPQPLLVAIVYGFPGTVERRESSNRSNILQPAAIVQREREILHDKIDAAAAAAAARDARASEEKEIYIVIFHEIARHAITGTFGKRKSRR